jgi:hypothetical protein
MRQEVYRVAYDEASAELSEILAKFDQLRLRKDRIEKVVEALKPLLNGFEIPALKTERSAPVVEQRQVTVPAEEPAMAAAAPVQPGPTPVPHPVQQAQEQPSDAFSRRIESVVGVGSAARDVREYSRLFNTGSSRGN